MVDALEILLSPACFTITVITLVLTILSALLLGIDGCGISLA